MKENRSKKTGRLIQNYKTISVYIPPSFYDMYKKFLSAIEIDDTIKKNDSKIIQKPHMLQSYVIRNLIAFYVKKRLEKMQNSSTQITQETKEIQDG